MLLAVIYFWNIVKGSKLNLENLGIVTNMQLDWVQGYLLEFIVFTFFSKVISGLLKL